MNKTKVKCPRCHSDQLYKFGLDKQANQKYQCKNCKRQFAPDSVSTPRKSKYPKCPKCGKATFLHHTYKHYNRYKCGNKKCNHVIVHHHNLNIDDASSKKLTGSLSMKGMRFPLHIILTALTLYLWLAIDSETRFILAFHLTKSRSEDSAFTLINEAKKFGEPNNFITDRLPSYNQAAAKVLPNTKHIPVAPMSSDTSNNLIESFNKTFKAWYKAKKGFNSFEKANNLI